MVTGEVNIHREAIVWLTVRGPGGSKEDFEAILDTGFTGALTLPSDLISTLRLPFRRKGRALLADGSESVFNTYEATVMWDGQPRHISVDAADTDPLLGMALLYNHEVKIQVVIGGAVSIRSLIQA